MVLTAKNNGIVIKNDGTTVTDVTFIDIANAKSISQVSDQEVRITLRSPDDMVLTEVDVGGGNSIVIPLVDENFDLVYTS